MTDKAVTTPARACTECAGALSWEVLYAGAEERWLGVCVKCGWMCSFLPDQPGWGHTDPLRTFLLGPRRRLPQEVPAWIRLFRITQLPPWNVDWVHAPIPCEGCGAHSRFHTRAYPRPGVLAACLVCLACGQATVEHIRAGRNLREAPVVGKAWAPPDIGVARLRAALLRPYWVHQVEDEYG